MDVSMADDRQIFHPEVQIASAMYDDLIDVCQSNIHYFESDSNEVGKRILGAFRSIIEQIGIIRQYVTEFCGFMHEYDFDEKTTANGYRSIVKVTQQYINHTMKVSKYIAVNRGNLLFRKRTYVKEIETSTRALASLCSIFEQAKRIRVKCGTSSLFPPGKHEAIELFNIASSIDQHPFYGRCIGLHYCESMQSLIKYFGIFMAGFSEMRTHSNRIVKATTLIYNGNKYNRNPERRAKRILDISMFGGVDFNQSFLNLTEYDLLHAPSNLFNAKIKVNRLITIPPEPLEIENVHVPNKMVKVPIPSSHLGIGSITVRLLSNVRRNGMVFKRNNRRTQPASNSLLFHCHGGGFIAQTSKSHEIYLREWAAELQVPILSVDYSLSPQAPYPRALEEIFYAYCWAIKNAKRLGTTAEKIIVVGDSAGATLNMALTLKCIEQAVRRPDGVCLIYSPLIIGFDPSPSRILCTIDVLLPFGFLMEYIKAYLHPGTDQNSVMPSNKNKTSKHLKKLDEPTNSSVCSPHQTTSPIPIEVDSNKPSNLNSIKSRLNLSTDRNPADDYLFDIPRDPYISPLYASDDMLKQFPPIKLLAVENDPFVDENVTIAKRLKALGKPVTLDILPGLPHGFLHFIQVSKDANEGNRLCKARLAELLGETVTSK